MISFGRQRKLLKLFASTVLLYTIYAITNTKTQTNDAVQYDNDNEEFVKDIQTHLGARRDLDEVKEDEFAPTEQISAVVTDAIYPGIVVYNRVPKCASSTVRHLISALRKRNKFQYEVHNWPNVKQSLTKSEEKEMIDQVTKLPQPLLFLRHLHFVDFETHNVTKPAYINVIRDPVERFVSHYYFSRFGFVNWTDDKIKKWLWPMPEERRHESLDDCVERIGGENCVKENNENMLDFFCGQDERCRKHDDWSLMKAEENIVKNYLFIGVLERLEESIQVAEAILPKYFSGATEIFRNSPKSGSHTKTAHKIEPSEKSRAALRTALKRETKLYSFILKRLDAQIRNLREKGKIT